MTFRLSANNDMEGAAARKWREVHAFLLAENKFLTFTLVNHTVLYVVAMQFSDSGMRCDHHIHLQLIVLGSPDCPLESNPQKGMHCVL